MTQEKQNKLSTNNITQKEGNIESDCIRMNEIQPTICYRDVSIAHITSGNALIHKFIRIGVVLNDETEIKLNFILEFGFLDWNQPISEDQVIDLSYKTMFDHLKQALVTGNKVDLCVNTVDPAGYRIVEVASKKQ